MTALDAVVPRIPNLDEAWSLPRQGMRLRAVRQAAERLRDRFAAGPRVVSVHTMPLSTLAYPTRYIRPQPRTRRNFVAEARA